MVRPHLISSFETILQYHLICHNVWILLQNLLLYDFAPSTKVAPTRSRRHTVVPRHTVVHSVGVYGQKWPIDFQKITKLNQGGTKLARIFKKLEPLHRNLNFLFHCLLKYSNRLIILSNRKFWYLTETFYTLWDINSGLYHEKFYFTVISSKTVYLKKS